MGSELEGMMEAVSYFEVMKAVNVEATTKRILTRSLAHRPATPCGWPNVKQSQRPLFQKF